MYMYSRVYSPRPCTPNTSADVKEASGLSYISSDLPFNIFSIVCRFLLEAACKMEKVFRKVLINICKLVHKFCNYNSKERHFIHTVSSHACCFVNNKERYIEFCENNVNLAVLPLICLKMPHVNKQVMQCSHVHTLEITYQIYS